MGKYDKEIGEAFSYIARLDTKIYSPEEFPDLYNRICSSTIPEVDVEFLYRELSDLLCLDHIDEIKNRISALLKSLRCEVHSSEWNIGIQAAEYLAMSCKQIAQTKLCLETDVFIKMSYEKQCQKNAYYGDKWHLRGIIGVCRDMGRKIIRMSNIQTMIEENKEDALDNVMDLLIFCVFYIVLARESNNE